MTDRALRVLLLGTHGQHNIGDELLLEAVLAGLGPDIEYVINSYDVPFTRAQLAGRYRAQVFDTARQRYSLWRRLGQVDAVVFAGGSIVKELYRSVGRFRLSTLLMLLAVVVAAHLRRVPVAMLHVGVGPISSAWGRRLARAVLRRVDMLVVRDAASARLCAELGVEARESVDAVFAAADRLQLHPASAGLREPAAPVRIALNLNFHIANPQNWEHFQRALTAALSDLAATRAIQIHALPMQSAGKENHDAEILHAFAQRVPEITVITHAPQDHHDVAQIISSCDVVVAERFHTLVIAALRGVPSYALVYDVKVEALVAMLGWTRSATDVNREVDAEALAQSLAVLIDERAAASAVTARRTAAASARGRRDLADARAWLATSAGAR